MGAGAGALLLTVANLASYIAGLIRDLVLAHTLGASADTDAFFAGFLIPDFLFNFLVLGFVSGALLPVFLNTEAASKPKAEQVFQGFLTVVILVTTFFSACAFVLAPMLISLFFGELPDGTPRPPDELTKILEVTRILLLSPILFGISNSLGMILLAKRRFLSMAVSPVLYNVGIILGLVFFGKEYGIHAAAWGAVGGATMHLLSRALDFPATQVAIRLRLAFSQELLTIIRLGIPKTIGLVAFQLVLVTFAVLATKTETGGLAAWNYARNVQSLPVSLFGIAFATAALPFLSGFEVKKNLHGFQHRLQKSAIQILFFAVPAAIGLMLVASETVHVLFVRGAFGERATLLTTAVLMWVSLAIPFESLTHLFSRAFLANKNTLLPAIGKGLFLGVAASSAYFLTPLVGIAAFGIAFSAAAFAEIVLLVVVFWQMYSLGLTRDFGRSFAKIILATCLLAAGVSGFLAIGTELNAFGRLGGGIALGAGIYLVAVLMMKIPEIEEVFLFRKASNSGSN